MKSFFYRGNLSLWGTNTERVAEGRVYGLAGLKVEDFPKGATKNRHLQLLRDSVVTPRDELSTVFQDISFWDETFEGQMIGAERIFVYSSCPGCKKKTNMERCAVCNLAVITNDFKVSVKYFSLFSFCYLIKRSVENTCQI